jgi:hypothetical protein
MDIRGFHFEVVSELFEEYSREEILRILHNDKLVARIEERSDLDKKKVFQVATLAFYRTPHSPALECVIRSEQVDAFNLAFAYYLVNA